MNIGFTNPFKQYSLELSFVRKLLTAQEAKNFQSEIDVIDKQIKIIKRHIKDFSLTQSQISNYYHSIFEDIHDRLRNMIFRYRMSKTDMEMLLIRRLHFQNCKYFNLLQDEAQVYNSRLITQTENTSWDVNFEKFTLEALCDKAINMLASKASKLSTKISQKSIKNIVHQICKNYNIVPYHNFTHAFQVFYVINYFYDQPECSGWILETQMWILGLAALCHDLQHNGTNNLFEIKLKSNLAVSYANGSILQNYHASRAVQLIQNIEDIQKLTPKQRKIIVSTILATDMAKHYDYVRQISEKKLNVEKDNDRLVMMEAIMHASDIVNPGMEYSQYLYWANLICMEFNDQTRNQENHGLQPTQFMRFNSLSYFYMNQITFANNVVLPLWIGIQQTFGDKRSKIVTQRIKENCGKVKEQLRRNSEPLFGFQKYLNLKLISNDKKEF